jgi:hypothetical protein
MVVSERDWLLLRGRLRALAPYAALPIVALGTFACAPDPTTGDEGVSASRTSPAGGSDRHPG